MTRLRDLGLSAKQSERFQKLAAMPTEHFETAVETAKATAPRRAQGRARPHQINAGAPFGSRLMVS